LGGQQFKGHPLHPYFVEKGMIKFEATISVIEAIHMRSSVPQKLDQETAKGCNAFQMRSSKQQALNDGSGLGLFNVCPQAL
jgi:hypothetical protein